MRRNPRLSLDRRKAKAHIIRGPTPLRIAQNRFEPGRDFVEKTIPLIGRQCGAERICECFQPTPHSSGQRRGTRNQLHTLRHKPRPAQTDFVFLDSRKVPRNPRSGIGDAPALKRGQQRDGNCADARMATQLTTNRPPATRARNAPVTGASGSSFTQCSTALEKTASNSFSKVSALASITLASRPRCRAAATMSAELSMPTTCAPSATSFSVRTPSPQPRSRMRSPACGCSKSSTGCPSAGTK